MEIDKTLQIEGASSEQESALNARLIAIMKVVQEAGQPNEGLLQYIDNTIQLPMSEKQWSRLMANLSKKLVKITDQKQLVKCFLNLDSGGLLEEVFSFMIAHPTQGRVDKQMNFALAVMLQYSDKLNFKILKFFSDNAEQLDPLKNIAGSKDLQVIFMLFDAQPFTRGLWDHGPLYLIDKSSLHENDRLLLSLILRFVSSNQEPQISLEQSLWIDENVRLDKLKMERQARSLEAQIGEVDLELTRPSTKVSDSKIYENGLVGTPSLVKRADEAIREIQSHTFRHLAIIGQAGSGKMSLVRLMKERVFDNQKGFIVVTLEETFDSKNLVGTYVCNETGEFVFKKGPLTVAAEQGLWLILRNIEQAPADLLSFLLPLVQENRLQVTSAMTITPKLGFRVVALCKGSGKNSLDDLSSVSPFLQELHLTYLEPLEERSDLFDILKTKFPHVHAVDWMPPFLHDCISHLEEQLDRQKGQMLDHRQVSVRQVFKLFARVDDQLTSVVNLGDSESPFLSSQVLSIILQEVIDVYLIHIYDKRIIRILIASLLKNVYGPACEANGLAHLDHDELQDYITEHGRSYGINEVSFFFGRSPAIPRSGPLAQTSESFVYTSTTQRLIEQVCIALRQREAILLVGETGTGKTTSVQELAALQGKALHVFNLNQNTDSSDLLGGFKPVDVKFLLKPAYELFLGLFKKLFKTGKNQQFLDLAQTCYEGNQVKEFIQCLNHGLQSIKSKKSASGEDKSQTQRLEHKLQDLSKRAQKLESGGGFIFQFIEGTLIKSLQNGDWILLDEINLASDSVLNRLATLIEGDHILLNERADIVETKRHPEFRIFMCMNPPYTSAGKKQLPPSLRAKLTELYVPELETEADLWPVVDRNAPSAMFSERQKRQILEFYQRARAEARANSKRGGIGLRNLSRALKMMRQAISLKYPVIKAIHDALLTCFASHLDPEMQKTLKNLIFWLFEIDCLPSLEIVAKRQAQINERYAYIEELIVPKGAHPPENFKESDFILTPTFKDLVRKLASIVAVTDFAVILEGPTSAGKTSTVQYLANVTHNKVIRINNHMHTDIQEYLGSYVPSSSDQDGKLVFQEGVLVEAVRHGYWVILDELNLAPSEVLEALNRLLDDNRELHIVETQKTIKAHPNFRIFATQNPTEGYGGRKELSEAFKNRFILIKVGDVPTEELQEILIQKCELPKSRAAVMVKTMENLQIYRSQGSLFAGKDSTITVRDLLKWANRVSKSDDGLSTKEIALEGFLVLGERSRSPQDKKFIKQTIETTLRCKIDEEEFYNTYFEKQGLDKAFKTVPKDLGIPRLIVSKQLQRLAVLVHKCLRNQEPVLLVGETGCGKTSLCQVFAALNTQQLFSINCHQNTETSDFIGCMRTRKNLEQTQQELANLLENTEEQLKRLETKEEDEPKKLYKEVQKTSLKSRADKVLKQLKQKSLSSNDNEPKKLYKQIKKLRNELNMVFEWHDGILVEAMRAGGLLLVDEISLANDSVLERLNSVFEHERTLILSEKSSAEAIKIVADQGFSIVATMNPSGDFGKKELSPALRNRMTEIWVESYFLQKDLVELYTPQNIPTHVHRNIPDSVDLFLIVSEMCKGKLQSLEKSDAERAALVLFNMVGFLNFVLSSKFSALQRKALSIRDIINAIEFLQVGLPLFSDRGQAQLSLALHHAVSLVILDGLCLGIDVAGDRQKEQISHECIQFLDKVLREVCWDRWNGPGASDDFVLNKNQIGVKPYLLDRRPTAVDCPFAFNAVTTRSNLHRLLRAYQLNKPVLIEGPPGVGKTSLIESLAKITGRNLTRVNLSEQTDMMDLLGSEYPQVQEQTGKQEGDTEEISFRWCDGALLRAIKEGHWFLVDEMNLAQQSVLEGLNAILDHRRTVYVPELNREFECHPDFFVFACQNPSSSSSSVGGRKTLPKSFLNRFNKIYLEELTQEDYTCILTKSTETNPKLAGLDINRLLNFSLAAESILKKERSSNMAAADEGPVNLRDLKRFLRLYERFLEDTLGDKDMSLAQCVNICYLQYISSSKSRDQIVDDHLANSGLFKDFQRAKAALVASPALNVLPDGRLKFKAPKPTIFGSGTLDLREPCLQLSKLLGLRGPHTKCLSYVVDGLHTGFPMLVVTDDCHRFGTDLQSLALLAGKKLNRIMLNDRSDTTQLLGCFEQTTEDFSHLVEEITNLAGNTLQSAVSSLNFKLSKTRAPEKQAKVLSEFLHQNQNALGAITPKLLNDVSQLRRRASKGQSRFEWVDSVLVSSIEKGDWVVFENANLCNPSILDRLNSLLEEGNNSLSINEQGLVQGDLLREVRAHEEFRAVFLMSKATLVDQGRDVSRALRNRCLQVEVQYQYESSVPEETEASDAMRAVSSLHAMQDCRILDIYHESLKFDLFPVGSDAVSSRLVSLLGDDFESNAKIHLGKRTRDETVAKFEAIVATQVVDPAAYLIQYLNLKSIQQDTVALYLPEQAEDSKNLLEWIVGLRKNLREYCSRNQIQQPNPQIWMLMLLSYKIQQLSEQIRHRISDRSNKILISNSTRLILDRILADLETTDLQFAEDRYLLLEYAHRTLFQPGAADSVQSQYAIFMLTRIQGAMPEAVMPILENQHGSAILRALRADSISLDQRLDLIECLDPNLLSEEQIQKVTAMRAQQDQTRESPLGFVWIKSLEEGSEEACQGLQGLKAHYSILCLNDDKELLKSEECDEQDLAEMISESSPYLVLIPKASSTILVSASSQYRSLCILKDAKKLGKAIKAISQSQAGAFDNASSLSPSRRLSWLYPMARAKVRIDRGNGFIMGTNSDWFVLALNQMNLEKLYRMRKSIEVTGMDRVLCDESQHLNLRDLPSYYACATGLLAALNHQLEMGNSREDHLEAARRYGGADYDASSLSAEAKSVIARVGSNLQKHSSQHPLQLKSLETILECLSRFQTLETLSIIEAMLVLPLEQARLEGRKTLEQREFFLEGLKFQNYHLRDRAASLEFMLPVKQSIEELSGQIEHLSLLTPPPAVHQRLQGLLQFTTSLIDGVNELVRSLADSDPKGNLREVLNKCELVNQLLLKGHDIHYASFSHIIGPLMASSLGILTGARSYLLHLVEAATDLGHLDRMIGLETPASYQQVTAIEGKRAASKGKDAQMLYENQVLWLLKLQRLKSADTGAHDQSLRVHALDHFVRKEIAKKLSEEQEMDDQEAQVMVLPFKMKVQSLMEDNKALDEMTAQDKERKEREAEQEIEINFPSYFDELQRQLFSLTADRPTKGQARELGQADHVEVQHREVPVDRVLTELLRDITDAREATYRTDFLRLRLEVVQMCTEQQELVDIPGGPAGISVPQQLSSFPERDQRWMEDTVCCLEDQVKRAQMKSVMNIADLELPAAYNFYHDAIPTEARLMFQPLAQLQERVRDILAEYESPILNDLLFLSNYMMTNFNTKTTPLMKMLTGLELLLEKLEEWQAYASKRLNSCLEEMNSIKQLIIRYRKIQILSWRNLLNHRRIKMVKEDFQHCIRLLHTVERQVFDASLQRATKRAANSSKNLRAQGDEVELQIFELVDLFIRDSSLGLFASRLAMVRLLYESLVLKQQHLQCPEKSRLPSGLVHIPEYKPAERALVLERIRKVVNILHFVLGYYSQFRDKLSRTIARLDAAARDKIKVLIDVSKWTLQKFTQVKSNIDKTHRQLNRACNHEEEILMQNIQTLVLTSSRKKYINTDAGGDKLLSLDAEKAQLIQAEWAAKVTIRALQSSEGQKRSDVLRQLDFFEKRHIVAKWPDSGSLECVMAGLFERLKVVRDLDKKHFQRRAFIDLLKFMKDEGLRPNFQDKLQPLIIESRLVHTGDSALQSRLEKYFYKSRELLLITESSSQVDENSDIRNVDVIRIQGFSQSLMHKILLLNGQLAKLETLTEAVQETLLPAPWAEKTPESQPLVITPARCSTFKALKEDFIATRDSIIERLEIATILEDKPALLTRSEDFKPRLAALTPGSLDLLEQEARSFKEALNQLSLENPSSKRLARLVKAGTHEIDLIEERAQALRQDDPNAIFDSESSTLLQKRERLLLKYVKLFYQDVLAHVKEYWEEQADEKLKESKRKESFDRSTVQTTSDRQLDAIQAQNPPANDEDQGQDTSADLSIEEQHDFSSKLLERLEGGIEKKKGQEPSVLKRILDLGQKVFAMEGLHVDHSLSPQDLTSVETCRDLIQKVHGLLDFSLRAQSQYLASLCKFSYLTQRVFLYLIYQGFCGQEDQDHDNDKQNEEDDKYFDGDGCGMGDGQGNQNVSNEIEHEEQLEGLKNYESEDEQQEKQDEQQEKEGQDEKEDNDFEMKEDFDGELEDKEQKDDEEDKKSDQNEDDQLDKVDDMLDNQLWDKNMEDMEQKEDENGENDDQDDKKEEIDLGDRQLDKQNQVDQKEKEMAAGDHDKQDESRDGEDEEVAGEDEEVKRDEDAGEEEEKPEEDPLNEMDNNEIPLDRDEIIEEDEGSRNPDEASEPAGEDQDMEGAESQAEENPEDLGSQSGDQEEGEPLDEKPEGFEEDKNEDMNGDSDNAGDEDQADDQAGGEDKNAIQGSDQDPGEDQEDNEQADLKKRNDTNLNEQQDQKQQNQQNALEQEMQTQFDVDGSDILFQLAQKIQEKSKEKQDKKRENKERQNQMPQEMPDKDKTQIENPNMNPDQKDKQEQEQKEGPEEEGEGMEYEFDEEAEQIQGKLATDKIQKDEDQVKDLDEDKPQAQEDQEKAKEKDGGDESQQEDAGMEKTEQEFKAAGSKAKEAQKKKDQADEPMDEVDPEGSDEGHEEARDLVDDYQKFLERRKMGDSTLVQEREEEKMEVDQIASKVQNAGSKDQEYDYIAEKLGLRALYEEWRANSDAAQDSIALLGKFKAETGQAAASLCEQLRIVLEPQLSQQLQGDYRTGKRLNMKKVISFIASHYRNDKIWLRRTLPSKRDYKILIAIDDSLSMNEQNLGFFSLEAMVTLVEALNRLEVGKVAVARIRDRMELLQSFEDAYSNERSAFIVSQFEFKHSAQASHDNSMAHFVRDANKLLDIQNTSSQSSGATSCPFVIILSDGRFNKSHVRRYMQEATEKRYLYIFVILDAQKPKEQESQSSSQKASKGQAGILSLRSAVKAEDGSSGIKLVPYLKDFPFAYYCIVQDLQQLPTALGSILVQWFSIMSSGGSTV